MEQCDRALAARHKGHPPVLRLGIPEGEMEVGVPGVPEEAGVAGVTGVEGVAGAGDGESGVDTALKASS